MPGHTRTGASHLYRMGLVVILTVLALSASYLPSSAAEHAPPGVVAPQQSQVGYVGPAYGSGANSTPTGEKPESKLWWNDGRWWGAMFSQAAGDYRIFWLDLSTQTWHDTGTSIGNRDKDKIDVLWDQAGQKLYVTSHVFSTSGSSTASNWAQLFRFSYTSSTKTYSPDAGFPVDVSRGRAEALTVDKDSTGRLWVTYVESNKVMVNHSTTNDQTWATPFQLPGSGSVSSDDISSVIAFGGNKIGVVWSNQSSDGYYLAIHNDGAAPNVWTIETAIQGNNLVDDHINLATDSSGRLYLAGKTSLTGNNPLVVLDVRGPSGGWTRYVFGMDADGHTRPIVLVDSQNQMVHMFATAPESGGAIYYKSANMGSISFPPGRGTVFMQAATGELNNSTSTKQQVNTTTGLVVLASNSGTLTYHHNYIPLGGGPPPTTVTPTPTTVTPTPTTVTPTPTTVTPTPTTVTPTPTTTTPTTTPPPTGELVFTPIHDTHVKTDRPTSNYGSEPYLRLRWTSTVDYDSYLKFSVTGTGGAVQSAILRMYSYDGGPDGGTVYTASNDYLGSSTPWTESGLTWNNAPGMGTPLYSAGNVVTNTWVSWDVTAAITGDGTYSFGLSNSDSNSVFYYSKEAASFRPELIIYTSGGPTPTATTVTPTATTVTPTPTTVTPTPTTVTPTPTTTTPTATPPPGDTLTLAPIADTHVKTDRATANYGTLDYVRVRWTSTVDYDTYFKFDVSGTGGQVSRAILWLYSYDGGPDGGTIYTASNNYLGSSTPWTETGLTWNNAPGMGTPLYSVGNVNTNSWAAWDVTAVIPGDGTYSFGLSSNDGNSVFYYTKEAANFQPRLEITLGGAATGFAAQAAPMMAAPMIVEESDLGTPLETPMPTVEVITPAPAPAVYTLPYADSFATGAGWIASGAWQFDALAGLNSSGWFANSALRGQSSALQLDGLIDLTSVLSPSLSFWQKSVLSAGDRFVVEASVDGGLTWLPLADEVGAVSDWTQRSLDLSAVSGQLVALRFRLDTTGDVPAGTTSAGLWLDDVAVNLVIETPTPPAETPVIEPPTEVPTEVPTETPTEIVPPVEPPTQEPPSTLLTVESDDPAVVASGLWTAHDTAEASGGRYLYSSGSLTDSLTLAFTGTQVDVVFVMHPALGSFAIEIDGVQQQIVSATGAETVFGARTVVSGLSDGAHSLRIVPVSGTVALDAFAVAGLAPLPPAPPVVEPPVIETPVVPTAGPTIPPQPEILPTATPVPLPLPFFDSFETGLTWQAEGSWAHALSGGYLGGGWTANADTPGQISTLTLTYLLDLRAAQAPQLTFWQAANLAGEDSVSLEVTVDGGLSWLPIDLQRGWNSAWAMRSVDLTGFRGTIIGLRFVLTAGPSGAKGNRSSVFGLDELAIQEAPPPTLAPTTAPLAAPQIIPVDPATPTPEPTQPPAETTTEIIIEVVPPEQQTPEGGAQ